MNFSFEPTES